MTGSESVTFTVDFSPIVVNNDEGEKDLIFSHTQTCTDTQGVDTEWYSWKGLNYTYSGAVDLSGSAGVYTLIAYCNDTINSISFDSNSITLRDFDTNATTECSDGYYLDGDGICYLINPGGTNITITSASGSNRCLYLSYGKYDKSIKSFMRTPANCIE